MDVAAGNIKDSFTGSITRTDYLGPLRRPNIQCGPMDISGSTATHFTVGDLVVTQSASLANPPNVVGPNNHVWKSFGPISILGGGTRDVNIPVGLGSWQLTATISGTGVDTSSIYAENFAHYEISASLKSSGTHVIMAQMNLTHVTEIGTMQSPLPPSAFTVVQFYDGATEIILRINALVNSNWAGFVRLVGVAPYV